MLPARSADKILMSPAAGPSLSKRISSIFEPLALVGLELGDVATYERFRLREPGLVSLLDERGDRPPADCHILTATVRGAPAAAASFIVESNTHRTVPACKFARIDLVITDPESRGLGLARLLVLSGLAHILDLYGRQLYSISCLAAHEAIEKILEDFGFQGRDRGERNYKHEEIKLDSPEEAERLGLRALEEAAESAQMTQYRLRQKL